MKAKLACICRRAFTLIELLVVITIVAILAGLTMVAANVVASRARNLEARAAIRDVTLAIKNYEADYNRLPARVGAGGDKEIDLAGGCALLKTLLGDNPDNLNPAARHYMEPRMARGGVNGLAGDDDQFSLVDPWGEPYIVVLDSDGDGRIANPDKASDDRTIASTAPAQLRTSVIVWSKGRDKKAHTEDDLTSWR